MSWLSQFIHNPIDYATSNPLKAAALVAGPAAAIAAPFLLPEAGALFGAGEAGAAGLGGLGAADVAAGVGEAGAAGGAAAGAAGLGAADLGGFGALGGLSLDQLFASGATAPEISSLVGGGVPEIGAGTFPGATAMSFAPDAGGIEGALGANAATTDLVGADLAAAGGAPASLSSVYGAAGAAPQAAAAGADVSSSFSPGGIMSWIKANPLMAASLGIGGGMIAKNALMPQKIPQQDQLTSLANDAQRLSAQNQSLESQLLSPWATGKLPDAQQKQVDQALQDSETSIRSKYASMGMSGSTVERDALANARNQSVVLGGQLAQQMAQAGLTAGSNAASALNISGTIYANIMNAQISQDNALQQAIAAFAGQAAIGAGIAATKKAA